MHILTVRKAAGTVVVLAQLGTGMACTVEPGTAGTGTGGTGTVETGTTDELDVTRGPAVVGLVDEGQFYRVMLDDTEGYYIETCSGPSLLEVNPPGERSRLPPGGTPFVLNGEYRENSFNLGCDDSSCEPMRSSLSFSKRQILKVGLSGTGGADGVMAYETYDQQPPFNFVNQFFTDPECIGKRYVMDPVLVSEVFP
jgi:hypothetical protein